MSSLVASQGEFRGHTLCYSTVGRGKAGAFLGSSREFMLEMIGIWEHGCAGVEADIHRPSRSICNYGEQPAQMRREACEGG